MWVGRPGKWCGIGRPCDVLSAAKTGPKKRGAQCLPTSATRSRGICELPEPSPFVGSAAKKGKVQRDPALFRKRYQVWILVTGAAANLRRRTNGRLQFLTPLEVDLEDCASVSYEIYRQGKEKMVSLTAREGAWHYPLSEVVLKVRPSALKARQL